MAQYKSQTCIGTIQKTTNYRKTYNIVAINDKHKKVKFEIKKLHKNDTILIKTNDGITETHYRVEWKPTIVAYGKDNTAKFNKFFEYWKNDMNEVYRNNHGETIIKWRDSYIPLKNIC